MIPFYSSGSYDVSRFTPKMSDEVQDGVLDRFIREIDSAERGEAARVQRLSPNRRLALIPEAPLLPATSSDAERGELFARPPMGLGRRILRKVLYYG